jgi:hypothetical protein
MDETEAVIAGRGQFGGVRVIGGLRSSLLRMFHDLPKYAGALRHGASANY